MLPKKETWNLLRPQARGIHTQGGGMLVKIGVTVGMVGLEEAPREMLGKEERTCNN
jgi:hypothetical protein